MRVSTLQPDHGDPGVSGSLAQSGLAVTAGVAPCGPNPGPPGNVVSIVAIEGGAMRRMCNKRTVRPSGRPPRKGPFTAPRKQSCSD